MIFIFFYKIIKNYYNLKLIHFFIKIYHTYSFNLVIKIIFYLKKSKIKKKHKLHEK